MKKRFIISICLSMAPVLFSSKAQSEITSNVHVEGIVSKILVDHVVVVANDELLEVPQKFITNPRQVRIGHEFFAEIPFDDFMQLQRADIPVVGPRSAKASRTSQSSD